MSNSESRKPVILITEDDVSNFLMTEIMLHQHVNAEVMWAKDGPEAVECCSDFPEIDLVLMDIKLPMMNGILATTEIKKIRPDLPIIAVTAYALIGDEKRIRDAGCDDYVAKPIRLPRFLEAIGRFIPLKN